MGRKHIFKEKAKLYLTKATNKRKIFFRTNHCHEYGGEYNI